MLSPLGLFAQSFKVDENTKSTYQDKPAFLLDTVVLSKYSKTQLYSNALNFVSTSFKDSRYVIEAKDSELGEIAFRGNVPKEYIKIIEGKRGKKDSIPEVGRLFFKCKIYLKDQKFKIVLYSLETTMSSLLPDIKFTVRDTESPDMQYNNVARISALELIKEMSAFVNRKPENDF